MLLADNKYKNFNLKNKWNTPSDQEEKILALEARLDALKILKGGEAHPGKKGKEPLPRNRSG